jgi:pyruvate kinase
MATKLASEIKAGDVILLKDGKTEIAVTDTITDCRSYVQISWLADNERRLENYHKDAEITLAQ